MRKLVFLLTQELDRILQNQYELIVVDDNSPDRTWKIALELAEQYSQLKVMRRDCEKGLATAVIRGWQIARGRVVGVIDGDLQHPPEILVKLWQQIVRGADLAIASRNAEGGGVSKWSFLRRFASEGARFLGLVFLPTVLSRVSDPMSGYFLVRRAAVSNIALNPTGYKISVEVLARGKITRISEVGYIFQERKLGASKVTFRQYFQYLYHLLRLRIDLFPNKRFTRMFCRTSGDTQTNS